MTVGKLKGLGAVLVLVAVSTVGCNAKGERQIVQLNLARNALIARNTDLQGRLSREEFRANALETKLKSAQAAQAASRSRRARPARVETAPAKPAAATGFEPRLYAKTLGSDVLFAPGSATLTAGGKRALAQVAATLKSKFSGRTVRVYGHTDGDKIKKSKKKWRDNLDLSANRAMAVSRYLIRLGVKAAAIETVAMDSGHPVASNKSRAGKAKNRRVEIVVIGS